MLAAADACERAAERKGLFVVHRRYEQHRHFVLGITETARGADDVVVGGVGRQCGALPRPVRACIAAPVPACAPDPSCVRVSSTTSARTRLARAASRVRRDRADRSGEHATRRTRDPRARGCRACTSSASGSRRSHGSRRSRALLPRTPPADARRPRVRARTRALSSCAR